MKNKKAFTLVELLGVIVVLAILALITIPIISNVISDVRIKALKASANGLIDASNLYYAQYGNSSNIRFDINDNKVESSDTDNLISYKGSIKSGTVILDKKGNVTVCVSDGKNSAYKNYNEKQVTTKKGQTCTIDTNSYIVKLSEDGDTLTELNNGQLTSEIKDLKEEIAKLKNEKADKTELDSKASTSDLSALDTRLSASISQLSSDIADVDGKIYTPVNVSVSSSYNATANTVKYTGVSVTIPANSYYSLSAIAVYNNSNVTSVWLADNSTNLAAATGSGIICTGVNANFSTYRATCSASGYVSSNRTFYLWAQHSGSNANTVMIQGYYLQKQ